MFIAACNDEVFAKEPKFTAICTSRETNFASARNFSFSRKQGTILGNNISVCLLWEEKSVCSSRAHSTQNSHINGSCLVGYPYLPCRVQAAMPFHRASYFVSLYRPWLHIRPAPNPCLICAAIWESCELRKPGREKSIIYTNSSRVMQAADYFPHIIALNGSVTMFLSFNFAGSLCQIYLPPML